MLALHTAALAVEFIRLSHMLGALSYLSEVDGTMSTEPARVEQRIADQCRPVPEPYDSCATSSTWNSASSLHAACIDIRAGGL